MFLSSNKLGPRSWRKTPLFAWTMSKDPHRPPTWSFFSRTSTSNSSLVVDEAIRAAAAKPPIPPPTTITLLGCAGVASPDDIFDDVGDCLNNDDIDDGYDDDDDSDHLKVECSETPDQLEVGAIINMMNTKRSISLQFLSTQSL